METYNAAADSEKFLVGYFHLRSFVNHDDAMALIGWEVTVAHCVRLRQSGGSTQELIELGELSDASNVYTYHVIDAYIDLRHWHSLKATKALSRVCGQYGINPDRTIPTS